MDLYTLKDLKKLAKENGIPNYENMSKQTLLQVILDNHQDILPNTIGNMKKKKKFTCEVESEFRNPYFYFWTILYTGKETEECRKIYKILDFFGQKYNVNSLPSHLIKSIVSDVIGEHDQSKEPLIFFSDIYIRSFTTIIKDDEDEILKQTKEDTEKTGYQIFKSLFPTINEIEKRDIIIHGSRDSCITTKFKGDIYNEFSCMQYLKHNYDRSCVMIPNINMNDLEEWNDLQIEYKEKSKVVIFPRNYWKNLKVMSKTNYRFIVMPFGFTCREKDSSHANIIIYDKQTKELERFDPNGFTSSICIENSNIDSQLLKNFTDNMGSDFISKYFAPTDFAPRYSIQQLQGSERLPSQKDPPGFCSAWSYWYANMRLLNPDIKRECLIQQILYRFKKYNIKLIHFIRNYSNSIENLKQDVKDLDKDEYKSLFKNCNYFTFNKLKYI
jgi:hypothetical protein